MAVLLVGVVGAVVLTGTGVLAHASFVSAQPAPGSDLASAPGTVELRFTEPLIADLSVVTVTDPLGQRFGGGPSSDTGMQVDVDSTAPGVYTVEWKTVSPIDGHTLTGSYQFGVGTAVGPQATASKGPRPGDLAVAVARAVEYLGLLGALGLLTLSALADGGEVGWRPAGLHRWVWLAAVGGILTVAGEVALASSGGLAQAGRSLLETATGRTRALRLVWELLAMTGATVAGARRPSGRVEPRRARVATALLVMAALAAVAAAGHAAGAPYGVWVAAGHLWTAGVWAGTILAMAVHRPPGGWRGDTGLRLAREFTPIALTAFTATVLLGLIRGVQELAGLADLWTTAYGQVLAGKALLVAVMAALSVTAWRRATPQAAGEGLAAAGVVLVAALLVAFPVPPGRAADDPIAQAAADTNGLPRPGDLTLARPADDTVVGLSIRPGDPGINDLYVRLVPPGGSGAEQIEVSLTVDDATTVATRRCGGPCRVATAPLEEGTRLTVQLTGIPGGEGNATFIVPALPAPDATELVTTMRARMDRLDSLRYVEKFGPADPPVRSSWELVLPDRLHGTIHAPTYRETIRIGDRWWYRETPEGDWIEADGSGNGLSVRVDNSLWDVISTNHHHIGTETVDSVPTRVVSFFSEVGNLPVWYRLWIDDDHRVRRALMLTQGHFMDQHYDDFNAPVTIEPPP